ncbi:MAG: diguanylate cyclase [bacterium]|nr:diguanylate cyclase [bacterium]
MRTTIEKPVVLIVDDEEAWRKHCREIFELHGHKVITAANANTAERVIYSTSKKKVVFVDINMPGRSGFELLSHIRDKAGHLAVPYAVTGDESTLVESKALDAGAFRVFHKGKDPVERLVLYAEKSHALRLLRESAEDFITGIDNFQSFSRAVVAEMKETQARPDPKHPEVFSLIFIDADEFKRVNDAYGDEMGDKALKVMGQVLRHHVRPTDHVCRKGGDEFLIWLHGTDEAQAVEAGAKLQAAVSSVVLAAENGDQIPLSISFGVSEIRRENIPSDEARVQQTLQDLIKKANKKEMGMKIERGRR